MGISILIVDDDKLLVDKLENTINWKKLHISMVFTAYNIRQAKKIMTECSIQILLCDIDMPQGNGLELLEWIREEGLKVECIYLSSYANFAYAQLALKMSARDYLLKPISNTYLEAALQEVVKIVQRDHTDDEENQEMILQMLWSDLLPGYRDEEQKLSDVLERGIYTKDTVIQFQILKITSRSEDEINDKVIKQYENGIRNQMENFVKDLTACHLDAIVYLEKLKWGIVMRMENYAGGYEKQSREEREFLKKIDTWDFCLYVAAPAPLGKAKTSWDRLEYMEINGIMDDTGILYESIWYKLDGNIQIPNWIEWETEMIHKGHLSLVQNEILNYILEQQSNHGWRKNTLGVFLWDLRMIIFKYLNNLGIGLDDIFDSTEYSIYVEQAMKSLQGVEDLIDYIFDKLKGNQSCEEKQENVIDILKDYIEQHMGENLSRGILAKQVYLSEDYVSKIFLKATGVSITNYIATRRVEKAKEYLKNTNHPVSRIAVEVGYSNFSYFSKTFREQVGCTPNEYRTRIQKNRHD